VNPQRIVFLDIDGVLNSDGYVSTRPQVSGELWTIDDLDPESIATLNTLVAATGAQFVLSSSWRHHHTLAEMEALLKMRGFSGTLIGATPRLFGETRGAEIRTWLQVQSRPPHAFAILDDELPSENLGHVWIRTDPAVGVTVSDVQRLIELLT
jgi:hypothetical protein